MSSKNSSFMYNHTNQTGTDTWTESEWKELDALRNQLYLAEKIILTIFACFTILGNTMVLVATWRERILHQPNKYFIACLAVADLLVGMILEPWRVYYRNLDYDSKVTMSIHLCRFLVWIDTFALAASIYSLTFISLDRYLKIKKPLLYPSKMTTSKSLKIIFIMWLISTAFATYATTPHSGSRGILLTGGGFCPYDNNKIKGFYTFLAVSAFFLPTAVILVTYTLIFVVVYKRQNMLRSGELRQTCNDRTQRSALLQHLNAIRTLIAVVGVFILCWGPYFFYILLWLYSSNLIESDGRSFTDLVRIWTADFVITKLPYFNSLCNPIIYGCLDQRYREAFKKLLQRMMCRPSPRRRQPPDAIELHPLRT
ncbi:5-hydroxytryptamine receptor 1-like [Paramuricea clavata]|uniref:5-hydroxytryptamine receptor 1-like n=1 Tax=Paramuricea clavata TaxID=317549 RepID=A0A6S7HQ60_PARCT|nr:5-hydroxytryptamine receptor 1-like [Paramuricea clavata]